MLIAEMEVAMAVELRISPHPEDYIRGSDMVSIMTGKWNELYKIKTGKIGRVDLSHEFHVQLGTETENFNLMWSQRAFDYSWSAQKAFEFMYGSIKLQGTVDGYDKENNMIIECKHTHGMNTIEKVTDFYMPQIQFYLYLSKAKQCLLSVILGNKYDAVIIDSSKEYHDDMLDKIKTFWEYVVHKQEPEDVYVRTSQKIKDAIPINGKTKRDVSSSNSFTVAVNQYLHNEDAAKIFEQAKKDIKAEMRDNESEIYTINGPITISAKRDKRGSIRITKKG